MPFYLQSVMRYGKGWEVGNGIFIINQQCLSQGIRDGKTEKENVISTHLNFSRKLPNY